MQPGEHITKYAKELTREQKKSKDNNVCVITDSDTLHMYMVEMWKCSHFNQQRTTEWVATEDKTFAKAIEFFNKKERKLEELKQSGGTGVGGFAGAYTATEITESVQDVATTSLDEDKEKSKRKDREHSLVITQLKSTNNTA